MGSPIVMHKILGYLFAISTLVGTGSSQRFRNGSDSLTQDKIDVHWLDGKPTYTSGTTFGLPWPQGKYWSNNTIFSGSASGQDVPLQSWITGYWPDGSIKWSGHAVPVTETIYDGYTVTASPSAGSNSTRNAFQSTLSVRSLEDEIEVNTGKLVVSFSKSGNILVNSIKTASGKTIGENGRLILGSQSSISDDDEATPTSFFKFQSSIEEVELQENSSVRALITVRGKHAGVGNDTHTAWLPFIVRFYLYAGSDAIRVIHSIVYDGDTSKDFITRLGIRFDVPLAGEELYNRHVRFSSASGGILSEAVRGITGLRRDPGEAVRTAQVEGKLLPDSTTWDTRVTSRLQWIPTWGDYSLSQLSSDGFTLLKRTKAGQSWIKIPAGTKAGGVAYLGGATKGGLAIGLRNFWKKYPTGLDIRNAASEKGEITLWLYSPAAQPLDLRPFHDGMGEEGDYDKQLDALEITYEDWEENYNTPYGIARTNEVFIYGFEETPSADTLAALTNHTNQPPVLALDSAYIQETKALGTYWKKLNSSESSTSIDNNLEFLFQHYSGEIAARRWYGFWDYGDVMHTYDGDRHTWRYDIGGYAWDNSELSPDIFFWLYFLRTGRADVYRFAEDHTRHTGEVDVYHIGKFKGLGTRHGVQHWGDSAKQVRISTPQYRKVYYYLSGGDERVGELMHETLAGEQAFLTVDPQRKVRPDRGIYVPDPTAISLGLGTDWSGLAASWLIEWERRGPNWEEAKSKLLGTMKGIGNLKYGFVTGSGLYNINNGELSPPAADPQNNGNVSVSHLSANFGLIEVVSELIDQLGEDLPSGFENAWLDYCYYYGAGSAEQKARYGVSFGSLSLKQAHSRLTAYAANRLNNATLAARAWNEFFNTDGLGADEPWVSVLIDGSKVLSPVKEASWLGTNDAALYGLAGIQNLAFVRSALNSTK